MSKDSPIAINPHDYLLDPLKARREFNSIRKLKVCATMELHGFSRAFKPEEMMLALSKLTAFRIPFSVMPRMIEDAHVEKKKYLVDDYFLVTVEPAFKQALEALFADNDKEDRPKPKRDKKSREENNVRRN